MVSAVTAYLVALVAWTVSRIVITSPLLIVDAAKLAMKHPGNNALLFALSHWAPGVAQKRRDFRTFVFGLFFLSFPSANGDVRQSKCWARM